MTIGSPSIGLSTAGKASGRGWALRVASRPSDGGGHIARCLTIARELAKVRPVRFRLDAAGQAWLPRLRAEGFDADPVPEPEGPWEGCLLDGYHFTGHHRADWRASAGQLAVLVDQGPDPAEADLIIRPGAAEPGDARRLTGFAHVLVAPAFAALPRRPPPAVADNLLLFFGRRDSRNASAFCLDALESVTGPSWRPQVTLVIGSDAPALATLQTRAATSTASRPFDLRLVVDSPEMPSLLAAADLAVGSGGVALMERLAAGVPSVTLALAENQRAGLQAADAAGATEGLGDLSGLTPPALGARILALARDTARRQAYGTTGRRLVDGRGAQRVVAALLGKPAVTSRGSGRPAAG